MNGRIRSLESELNTLKTAKMASDQFAFNVVKQAEEKGLDVKEEEMADTVSLDIDNRNIYLLQMAELAQMTSVMANQGTWAVMQLRQETVLFSLGT